MFPCRQTLECNPVNSEYFLARNTLHYHYFAIFVLSMHTRPKTNSEVTLTHYKGQWSWREAANSGDNSL